LAGKEKKMKETESDIGKIPAIEIESAKAHEKMLRKVVQVMLHGRDACTPEST
jgi:hypothetical protein